MIFIGIDPGASGGIARSHSASTLMCMNIPRTERGILREFSKFQFQDSVVCIEKIPTAIFGADKSSGAKLYGSYMQLRMALVASSFQEVASSMGLGASKFYAVSAKEWQKEFGLKRKEGTTRTEWKNLLKRKAQELFPRRKITLNVSDAILIAEFCRRKYNASIN